ncbi:MAG: GMC family oxidoreductase [Ferruginibacter sp.]|nr:GMC family oxidoreductase [Cytophagales bacterium]
MQITPSSKVYDVCVVGSGAGGGMAAKVLTEGGATVAMIEAGPLWDASKSMMFSWPYDSPRRGANTERPFGEFDAAFGGWEIEGEPYTNAPGTKFDWFRSRMLGGRTNHWGRISLRFGPNDFRRRSIDGLGDDWPITYDEIKPYYDKVDRLVGVFGSKEGIYNEPDGIFMPPPRPRAYELLVKRACEQLKIKIIPSRLSILTQPLNGRPACHYCSQCNRGCTTNSNFSSSTVLIPPAMATGRLEILANSMAREVTTDSNGQATGVSYVSKLDGKEYAVRAKIVVLAASAGETARLMLNSKSARHPNGIGNSSDVVGRYIMDSTGASAAGLFPQMMDLPPHNEDGVGGMHLYMPWWLDNKKLDFPRGYHIEFGGGKRMPGFGFMGGLHNYNYVGYNTAGQYASQQAGDPTQKRGGGGYGKQLKDDYRRYYGATIGFSGRGEAVARKENYCEIDPNVVDKYGIPVLRFHYTWSDYEFKQAKHMQETFREIIQQMGGQALSPMPTKENGYGIDTPGRIIHEVGVARMGNDPKSSAVNKYCQAHDVKNLFVADAASFVSQADKNPTWTILALSMRTAEYIIQEKKRMNI